MSGSNASRIKDLLATDLARTAARRSPEFQQCLDDHEDELVELAQSGATDSDLQRAAARIFEMCKNRYQRGAR